MRRLNDAALGIGLPTATALIVLGCGKRGAACPFTSRNSSSAERDRQRFFPTLPQLLHHALITGSQSLGAFLVAVLAGFIAAAAISQSRFIRDMLYPNIIVLQILPKVALAPLFIVWLGIDSTARVAFAAFLSFFPVLISTAVGLQNTDVTAVRLCRSADATNWQIFWAIRVPFALPYFFTGVKIAATMSVTGVVIAEFITAKAGLGFIILSAGARSETDRIFAAILMLCFVGLGLYGAVAALEGLARRWYRG